MSTAKYLGRAIVERDGKHLLCMMPSGHVKRYTSYQRMLNGMKAWASKNTGPNEVSKLDLVFYDGGNETIYASEKSASV
jgi:hypothetical protein